MQKYQEKPIALVLRDESGKYSVNQEALQLFISIEGKLAIISVAGVYRTGKSFLLNTMLLNCKNGFAVGPTVNPKTKGIWVWGKPMIFKNQKDQIINVLVLDSEGLGSTEEDVNHDLRLFSITLLLSSAFMYNTVGAIDQNAIDRLGLVLRLCEHLKNDNFNDFPDFYWILRDFSLELVDRNNNALTTKAYLQNCLSNQPGDLEYRNLIRQSIKQAFQIRNCYTFVRPLTNQQSLQNLDKMQLEQLRPEFVEQVIDFRKSIFSNLRVKSIKGRQIKGKMLCELINIYVQCINGDKLPVIQSGWQQLCLKQLHEVLFDIEEAVAAKVRDLKQRLPRSKKQLMKQQQILMEEFQSIFSKRLKNNDKAKQYFNSVSEIISKELKGIEEEMKIKNVTETQSFVKKQFQGIEKRLKQSEFKSMGQLVKQFETFYEFFRKKCPYKDEIQVGLQFLMKKFSDCSMILSKNIVNKKDSEISELRQQLQNALTEFSAKQEKFRSEKNIYQDKTTKLQANLQDLKKQNDEMIRTIEQLQGKLQIAQGMNNNAADDQLSQENIRLKKKIMNLQDKQREMSCLQEQKINQLIQQIQLKNNSLENYQKQKNELSKKVQELQLDFKNYKEASQFKIHELNSQIEGKSEKLAIVQKTLKQKIIEKEQTIDELEKTLELKNDQISEINNKTTQQNSILTEITLQQQRKFLMEKQKQVSQLKSEYEVIKQTIQKKIHQLQSEASSRETEFRITKLQLQQEKALLTQKIQFIQIQSGEKNLKNKNLQQQINSYVMMFEQKDEEIQQLKSQIEQLRQYELTETENVQRKLTELVNQLNEKNQQIKSLESTTDSNSLNLNKMISQKSFKINQLEIILSKNEEEVKKLSKQLADLKSQKEDNDRSLKNQIQNIRSQSQKDLQDQQNNAQRSLCQLKNFYELEKQKLQKRILQQRKKFQYNQTNLLTELKNKYSKQIKILTEQNNENTAKIQELEDALIKTQNQYEIKVMGLEQDLQNQRKTFENKFLSIKKKYDEASQQLNKAQKRHEQDRIQFVKKREQLNFEVSKRQKQLMQSTTKRETLEATIAKKDSQIQSIKKAMTEQIQSSLNEVQSYQQKYQKINQQYSRFKMQAQKQNALLKQKNEFLNSKIADLTKEKDTGSLRSLQKIEQNKIKELKDQIERQKAEYNSLQAKMQNLRKNEKESLHQYKRELNETQKQSQLMKQKIQIYEAKINELQSKILQKTEQFKKQVEQMRAKYSSDRLKLQNDLDSQKQKYVNQDDQKSRALFSATMELTLVKDKLLYAQNHRDQYKKQLQQTEKRLQNAINQAKKQDKGLDVSQAKRTSVDKRYSNQLELMKFSSKAKQQDLEEVAKKLKEQNKILKSENFELQQKLRKLQKTSMQQKSLIEQVANLKKEREQLITNYKNQIAKQSDEAKKKYAQLEKKNRQLETKNNTYVFEIQKDRSKTNLQKSSLIQKIKLQQQQLYQLKKLLQTKVKPESSKSKLFSMSTSDIMSNYK